MLRYCGLCLLLFTVLLVGCSEPPLVSQAVFSRQVEALLGGQTVVTVPAGRLTGFAWQQLCFQRDDRLQLTFDVDGTPHRLRLSYEDFFVDEDHVADSLAGVCIPPDQRIVVRRKYPGASALVSFHALPSTTSTSASALPLAQGTGSIGTSGTVQARIRMPEAATGVYGSPFLSKGGAGPRRRQRLS